MNYKFFMVPGILVILLTMVGASLSALNIVKEKEIGTIEQINVTPVKKHHFILGKLIPFWVIGLIILSIGLLIAWLAYGIVPAGSLLVIYSFAALYLLAVFGLGLLISTVTNNQQQAMLISFFMMMVFVLLGGLYTSWKVCRDGPGRSPHQPCGIFCGSHQDGGVERQRLCRHSQRICLLWPRFAVVLN